MKTTIKAEYTTPNMKSHTVNLHKPLCATPDVNNEKEVLEEEQI